VVEDTPIDDGKGKLSYGVALASMEGPAIAALM
jgi:hypothetical protein